MTILRPLEIRAGGTGATTPRSARRALGLSQFDTSWQTFTPTIGAGTGTFGSVSGSVRWKQLANVVFFSAKITITTNGTAAGNVNVSGFPVPYNTTHITVGAGRASAVSGKMLQVVASGFGGGTGFSIWNFDNTYPGANGEVLDCSGYYEVA